MKRLTTILTVLAALVGAAVIAAPVGAATALTGTIVQPTATGYAPLAGVTLLAHEPRPAGGPGKVIATARTGADGAFAVEGLSAAVCLEVDDPSGLWQGGWVWPEYLSTDPAFPSYVQFLEPDQCTVAPTAALGAIQLQSALAGGRVVDLVTGLPIARATVRYDPYDTGRSAYSTLTGADGRYLLTGLDYEEYTVRVSAKGYVGGYLGYDNLLYRTWGEATTHAVGDLGDIRMAPR